MVYDRQGYESYPFNSLTLQVHDGVVTVGGLVVEPVDKDSALGCIQNTPRAFATSSTIFRSHPSRPSDNRIRARPVSRDLRLFAVHQVRDQSRQTDSHRRRERPRRADGRRRQHRPITKIAGIRANQVPGVFSVQNDLQVAGQGRALISWRAAAEQFSSPSRSIVVGMRSVLHSTRVTLEMIKWEHSIFALPFALTGAVLAAGGWPPLRVLGWIIVCMVGARSAAMAFNRLADAEIDAVNPRTAARAIPAGQVSRGFVITFTIVSCAVFLLGAAMLNRLTLELAPLALAIVFAYSYMKRVTRWSHLVLGLALGIAPAAAWIAVRGSLSLRRLCSLPRSCCSGSAASMCSMPARTLSMIAASACTVCRRRSVCAGRSGSPASCTPEWRCCSS